MAHFFATFFSKTLARPVHFTAVLCNDNAYIDEANPHYKRPAKNVYLLHGYSGCDTDWFVQAPLTDLANTYHVNFFMPSGDNSFYLDQKATGFQYAQYVGKEFIEYTRQTFGLSDKKEDTMIGGLSMGGFGAIHTGLLFPETFSKIIALSSALITNEVATMEPGKGNSVANYEYYHQMFGDMDKLLDSQNSPEYLIKKLKKENQPIPALYMACGTEDFLLTPNNNFKAFLDEQQVPVTYFTGPGIHDYVFWRAQLKAGLEWAL